MPPKVYNIDTVIGICIIDEVAACLLLKMSRRNPLKLLLLAELLLSYYTVWKSSQLATVFPESV
jgi:hypothetical protein